MLLLGLLLLLPLLSSFFLSSLALILCTLALLLSLSLFLSSLALILCTLALLLSLSLFLSSLALFFSLTLSFNLEIFFVPLQHCLASLKGRFIRLQLFLKRFELLPVKSQKESFLF